MYVADQAVSRGGSADVYGDSWRRDFLICLPVSDRAFWSRESTIQHLQAVLKSASDDTWQFKFSKAAADASQLNFHLDPNELLGEPDSAFLFSGGLDSLCAVVEAAYQGAKPLLIGHSPAFHVGNRQRELAKELQATLKDWNFPYLSMAVHRRAKRDPGDYTQRTRSFLYAVIGAVIAQRLGFPEVNLPDNGVVSVNLPINDQLLGAKASRSTHPKFLRDFSKLASLVFGGRLNVVNPLWSRTRAESVDILRRAGVEQLLEATNSCSHPRNLSKLQPHCGSCSQCIDRRFATLATGLEEYDPGERYALDIFRQELPAGNAKTMALSYVRFAQQVAGMDREDMFTEYPQLYECIDPTAGAQRETAQALTEMISRHGSTVVRVLKDQIERSSEELAAGTLPDECLLRLVSAPEGERPPGLAQVDVGVGSQAQLKRSDAGFTYNDDYRSVTLQGASYALPPTAAEVIRVLHLAAVAGQPEMTWKHVSSRTETSAKSMSEALRGVPRWRELVATPRKGVYRLNLTPPQVDRTA